MARFGSLGTQYFDNSGDVLSGGKIYFYESGTTTLKNTFTDSNETTANTNPVILTADGRQPNIFFSGSSKGVLSTSAGVIIETRDPLGATDSFTDFDAWNSTFNYAISDIVTGSDLAYYVSLTNGNQGNNPAAGANPADWTLIDFIRTWNTNESYVIGEIVKGSNGFLYTALVAQSGNNPVGDATNWRFTGIPDLVSDLTPQLGGNLSANGHQIQWSKGADVASAAALPVLTDGNYFDVTGTTTVTSINTTASGTVIKLHFDAALILTHNATSLVLPGGANITTAANDEAEFIEYSTGNWRCTSYTRADGTALFLRSTVVQVVNTQTGAVATGTTAIPKDDTIPQNTEGDQYMSLTITPTSASNMLKIDVVIALISNTAGAGDTTIAAALFQDATAGALAVGAQDAIPAYMEVSLSFSHYMEAGTTSATTFKVRAGGPFAGTTTFNGLTGTRRFGGALASSITITEVSI